MTKEFVPAALAQQLKEAGFDEPCFAHYRDDRDLIMLSCGIAGVKYSYISESPLLAPLWQTVVDWLETKKVFISIEYAAPDTNKFHYRLDNYNPVYRVFESQLINKKWESVDTGRTTGNFGSYSKEWYKTRIECLNAAISEAMTLINKPMGTGTVTSIKF